jgi:acetylornithine deacetylase/succinyl-diaminopimelate desuccinylase-like protein
VAVKDIVGIKDKSFKFLVDNFDNYIRILRDLIRYKSVASWADNELSDCANYISDILKVRGFKVDLKSGGGLQ